MMLNKVSCRYLAIFVFNDQKELKFLQLMNTNAILRCFHLSTCLFTPARTHTPPCFSEKYCTFDTDIKYGALMH